MFHITICAKNRIPWCTRKGVPEIIIDNLVMTRNIHGATLYAFCILPDHVHVIVKPRRGGLSNFMCSFKSNASRDARRLMGLHRPPVGAPPEARLAAVPGPPLRRIIIDPPLRVGDTTNIDAYSIYGRENQNTIAWQKGYYDERIRDGRQFSTAIHYVQGNGMRHGLVEDIIDWPWSSIHFPKLIDPCEVWLD
jgi:REP element-mobilizing transposase RayT